MAEHSFQLGDEVIIRVGHLGGEAGTITKIVPDPKGGGDDVITVRLHDSLEAGNSVLVHPADLRMAG